MIPRDPMRNIRAQVVAEIGIREGKRAISFLRHIPTIHTYWAVDPWLAMDPADVNVSKWAHQAAHDAAYATFMTQVVPYHHKVRILRMTSLQAAPHVEDGSLDGVFIDANHTYFYVQQDIQLWWPKVRMGGIVAGDDYQAEGDPGSWGVHQAVDEFFPASRLETCGNQWMVWKKEESLESVR